MAQLNRSRSESAMNYVRGWTLLAFIGLSMPKTSFAFTPKDCEVTDRPGSRTLVAYCARLAKEAAKATPPEDIIGRIDKAEPIPGEPASKHFYEIHESADSSPYYFDGNSAIGRRILKACDAGEGNLCRLKISIEKSWEHKLDHATFWVTKVTGEPSFINCHLPDRQLLSICKHLKKK
jgi:hypothetical protein